MLLYPFYFGHELSCKGILVIFVDIDYSLSTRLEIFKTWMSDRHYCYYIIYVV